MKIRELLLIKLAQNPDYVGENETEKALVKELKVEMAAAFSKKDGEPATTGEDTEVKAEATKLADTIAQIMKDSLSARETAAAPAVGSGVAGLPTFDKSKLSKEERFAGYVKGLYEKDFGKVKALSEGSDENGGYLVPDEFRAELIQEVINTDSLRKYCTVIPMSSKYLEIPKLTSDVRVYWGTENRTITTTTADFGNVTLTPFRLNAIIYTSRELFEDAAISVFEILRQRFTARVADEEMRVFMGGNGTTQPKGINTETTIPSVTAASALTPDHITKAYWKLPTGYRGNARWIINSRVMEHLENAKETGTGAYLYPSLQAEVKTLKGRPILITDHQPSAKITLGDPKFYYVGDRKQVSMEMSTEAGTAWEKHQVGLKLTERLDGKVALITAFVQITNTNIH